MTPFTVPISSRPRLFQPSVSDTFNPASSSTCASHVSEKFAMPSSQENHQPKNRVSAARDTALRDRQILVARVEMLRYGDIAQAAVDMILVMGLWRFRDCFLRGGFGGFFLCWLCHHGPPFRAGRPA